MDADVDSTVLGALRGQGVRVALIREIGDGSPDLGAGLGLDVRCRLGEVVGVEVGQEEARAVTSELDGGFPADLPRSAGDQGEAAVDTEIHQLPVPASCGRELKRSSQIDVTSNRVMGAAVPRRS